MKSTILTLVLVFCVHVTRPCSAAPDIQWQHVYPYPTAAWLKAVTWGPAGFVAAGAEYYTEDEILFSADGKDWRRITPPGTNDAWFEAATYHDGKYVLVGSRNLILVSTNGLDWSIANSGTNGGLYTCAGGEGILVAAGYDRTLFVSTDGIEWQKRTTPETFVAITFGNGVWVALTGGSTVYASSNLEEWAKVETGDFWSNTLTSLCFGNGRFVAGGAFLPDEPNGVSYGTIIKTSTNGVDWVSVHGLDSAGQIRSLVFSGGQFVGALKGHFLRSADGLLWERVSPPDAGGDLVGITASDSGQFVAVGTKGAMLRSDDATAWEVVSKHPREEIRSIAWAKGRFVAAGGSPFYLGGPVGSAAVLSSTNGRDWQATLTNLVDQLSGVAYGNRIWVVTGDNGQIFTSRNGLDWTDRSLPPTTHDLWQVVYGGGRFVAFSVWRDLVYRSINGKRWTAVQAPLASEIGKVKFLNRRFVGAGGDGEDGFIFTSRNGVRWKKTTLGGIGWLAGVAYGNRRYVAAGRSVSAVSFDGAEWNVYLTPRMVYDLQYIDGWFVGVGPNGMMFSRDGIEWQVPSHDESPENLSGLSAGEGTVVGGYGATLYRGILRDAARPTLQSD